MTLFDLDPKLRWLFAMTHPDDELSICCWIKRLSAAGAEVWLSWTHSTPEREQEALESASRLGVDRGRLRFHRAADGKVAWEMPQLLPRFEAMISEIRPDRVVCGAFEQGHPDHDATNLLVNLSFAGPVLETPFYHTYGHVIQTINRFSDPSRAESIALTADEFRFKQELSRAFPSQRIGDLLIWFELWDRLRGQGGQLGRFESLRLQAHFDFRRPQAPDEMVPQILRSRKWQEWIAALDVFEAAAPGH